MEPRLIAITKHGGAAIAEHHEIASSKQWMLDFHLRVAHYTAETEISFSIPDKLLAQSRDHSIRGDHIVSLHRLAILEQHAYSVIGVAITAAFQAVVDVDAPSCRTQPVSEHAAFHAQVQVLVVGAPRELQQGVALLIAEHEIPNWHHIGSQPVEDTELPQDGDAGVAFHAEAVALKPRIRSGIAFVQLDLHVRIDMLHRSSEREPADSTADNCNSHASNPFSNRTTASWMCVKG